MLKIEKMNTIHSINRKFLSILSGKMLFIIKILKNRSFLLAFLSIL